MDVFALKAWTSWIFPRGPIVSVSLPHEIWAHIFVYLKVDIRDLKSAGLTCRSWREVTLPHLFQNLTNKVGVINTLAEHGDVLRVIGPAVRHLTLRPNLQRDSSVPLEFHLSESLRVTGSRIGNASRLPSSPFPNLVSMSIKEVYFAAISDMYWIILFLGSTCKSLTISSPTYSFNNGDPLLNNNIWSNAAFEIVAFEDNRDYHVSHRVQMVQGLMRWLQAMPWLASVRHLSLICYDDRRAAMELASLLHNPDCLINSLKVTLIDNYSWESLEWPSEQFPVFLRYVAITDNNNGRHAIHQLQYNPFFNRLHNFHSSVHHERRHPPDLSFRRMLSCARGARA
jgi:hypothetical protein